jgi:hypothetical protein
LHTLGSMLAFTLIFEFRQPGTGQEVTLDIPGQLAGQVHLKRQRSGQRSRLHVLQI